MISEIVRLGGTLVGRRDRYGEPCGTIYKAEVWGGSTAAVDENGVCVRIALAGVGFLWRKVGGGGEGGDES